MFALYCTLEVNAFPYKCLSDQKFNIIDYLNVFYLVLLRLWSGSLK